MNSYRSTHSNSQIDLSLSSYMKNLFNEDMSMNDNKKSKIRKGSAKKGSCTTAKEKPKDGMTLFYSIYTILYIFYL